MSTILIPTPNILRKTTHYSSNKIYASYRNYIAPKSAAENNLEIHPNT